MKISDNNLIPSLDNKLQNIYVLLADDSVRIKECLDKIYSKAKLELFTEKETYVIESKTKWDFLTSESSNLDMFGSKKIIEIKLLGQGPGIKGSKALKDYAKEPDSNILLIVTAEGLDKKSFSSAFKCLTVIPYSFCTSSNEIFIFMKFFFINPFIFLRNLSVELE